jgi:anti-sigma B factor antagonist
MSVPQPRTRRPNIDVSTTQRDGATVVAVRGDIDLATAPTFSREAFAALETDPSLLVLDLTSVDFLASIGLGILVELRKVARPEIGVVVVADGPATSRVIQITGVDEAVPLHATVDDALRAAGR